MVSVVSMAAEPAGPSPASVAAVGPWALTSSRTVSSGTADQGLTTVVRAGRAAVVTRGASSIPSALAARGWSHIGDPDSLGGSVLDAYQSSPSTGAKLFTLTTAAGERFEYRHRLTSGEDFNNSFAAVAPGRRWFVAGEWATMTRLLEFAVPHPTVAALRSAQSLPLAATIRLTHPVRDVQGCAFTSSTSLICSTNDPGTDLYPVPRQFLTIQLTRPLDGRPVAGTPHLWGAVPAQTICAGPAGEVEGIDVHADRMMVAVNLPCGAETELFTYTDRRSTRHSTVTAASATSPPSPG
jgi:hypothetical protein